MRFGLLTSVLALISTTLAASAPKAAGIARLKQATRAQIVRRMQNRQSLGRRQSLPSAGVYPTCPDSLPASSGGTITAYAPGVRVAYTVVPPSPEDPDGDDPRVLIFYTPNGPRDCRSECYITPDCSASYYIDGVPPGDDSINCILLKSYTGAEYDEQATSAYLGRSCSDLAGFSRGGQPICCNYYGPI